ncbi:MAG: HNH endonuclease [Actinomycetota bacterium]
MTAKGLGDAIALLEKANADLEPELLTAGSARALLDEYAKVVKLGQFGVAVLSRKVDDISAVARASGTSLGAAKETVSTGRTAAHSADLDQAMRTGAISLDQATEIAKAEEAAPGVAKDLIPIAESAPFHVLKEKARKAKLDAERHKDLAKRQHEARHGRSYTDDLGMIHIDLALEPHMGAPIVACAEAEAERLARAAKKNAPDNKTPEPFERYRADAYAAILSGGGKGRAKRPELVILVSHEVAKRGWHSVKADETCKIPGIGPIAPEIAKDIAQDAFLNGVFYDGKDLRHFKRFGRNIPKEIQIALELGPGPDFDGVSCVDCGNRIGIENDHSQPIFQGGPTSLTNFEHRCWPCHAKKTRAEMDAAHKDGRHRKSGQVGVTKRGRSNAKNKAPP